MVSRRVTVTEYLAIPEEAPYLEYLHGEVVEKPGSGFRRMVVTNHLTVELHRYEATHGGISGPEARVEFQIEGGTYFRLPDVAYWAPGRQVEASAPCVHRRSPPRFPRPVNRSPRSGKSAASFAAPVSMSAGSSTSIAELQRYSKGFKMGPPKRRVASNPLRSPGSPSPSTHFSPSSIAERKARTRGSGTLTCATLDPVIALLLWLFVFILAWPVALLALVIYPLLWLLLLPFRIFGIAVDSVLQTVKAILLLPARVLGGRPR
jgi:hypothetical protein